MRLILISLLLRIIPAHAYSSSYANRNIFLKLDKCKIDDIVILEFNSAVNIGVAKKVVRICDYNSTIFSYIAPQKDLKIGGKYVG